MVAFLNTIFIRGWEKALFLIALLICLTLCSLATHYFTAEPEEQDSVGHRPVAVSILPWQNRQFFSLSVPEATVANPFAHTLASLLPPPEPPKPAAAEQPKQEKPAEKTASAEKEKTEAAQVAATQPPAQEKPAEKKEPEKPAEPPPPPPKPDIVFTICYRGFYVDVRGESLAMLLVTNPDKKESRLFCKKGTVICEKVTFQNADDSKATFTDADGNATTIDWNGKHTFTFKQE